MRRLFILGLLFGLVYILQFLQVGGEGVVSAQSLVSVGFILLAAYTLGEITSRFGLPKITGYILTGLVFGPYVINLFSVEVVDNLKIINGLAIGLIALSAGGEMKVSSLKQIARSLTLLVLIKGGLILLAIMGAVYAVAASGMLPFLADAPTSLILAVGGLFGVLAIGTSPAATIAVINETGSRGRLADTTLGVAVFKDVVMVVLLAIFIALAKVFSSPDAVFDPHVLLIVGEELGFSILAGAVLGGIILLYIRFINAEMWLFVIAIIFSMNAFAESFHLEALLLFITAGFIVQNFSEHGDDFVHLIESVALPVYVVFFSVAGAGLNLNALAQVGLVAGILVVVRVIAIFAGTRLATRLAGEPEAIQKNAWLSFISQAGVVIGLTIIIENNLPELGPEIRIVVLGTIAINLLAGPVLFKMALAKVGETREQREGSEAAVAPSPEDGEEPGEPAPELPEPPSDIHYAEPDFASPKLTTAALRVQEGLIHVQQDFQDQFIAQERETLRTFLAQVRDRYEQTVSNLEPQVTATGDAQAQAHHFREARIAFSEWLQSEVVAFGTRPERTETDEQAFEDFTTAIHLICQRADERFVVIQEPERFAPTPGDNLYVRFRKSLKRVSEGFSSFLGSGVRDTRTIPFQRIAHYQFDGLLPGDMVPVANLMGAAPLFVLDKTRILNQQIDEQITTILDRLQPEEGPPLPLDTSVFEQMQEAMAVEFEQALADITRYYEDIQQRVAFALVQRYQAFLDDLDGAGTFELPARRRRFSLVYEASQDAKQEIHKALDRWETYAKGAAGNLAKHLDVVVLADHIGRHVDDTVVQVSATIREQVGAHVATAKQACTDSQQRLEAAFAEEAPPAESKRTLVSERQTLLDTLDQQSIEPLEVLRESRTLNALLDQMLAQFSTLATEVPETYTVVEIDDLPSA
ncbi:MAG TPA: cation:proton antiporter, partial [Rhodothermales bacterium]|nr:cation:proton antiporter [Rhodothermales bacterium]